MKTTIEFLDAVKAQEKLKSDYVLAKFLNEGHARISNYRTGTSHFNGEMCLKIEKVLKLPEGYVSSCIEAERAKTGAVQKMWRHVAAVLIDRAAAFMVLAVLPALLYPGPILAGNSAMYIMSNRKP